MLWADCAEFGGRALCVLAMSGLWTAVGMTELVPAFTVSSFRLLLLGVFFTAIFLPLFLYASMTKKVILTSTGIEYYVGRRWRFRSKWADVSKIVKVILPFSLVPGAENKNCLHVFAGERVLVVHSLIQMPTQRVAEIFEAIERITREHPRINIEIRSKQGTEKIR